MTAIDTIKQTIATITAQIEATTAAVEATYPTPADDCTDDAFDAWNDAYETALMESGVYGMERAKKTAEDELIRAVRDALAGRPGFADALPAFTAALGEGSPRGFVIARRRTLDLCFRLDTATI